MTTASNSTATAAASVGTARAVSFPTVVGSVIGRDRRTAANNRMHMTAQSTGHNRPSTSTHTSTKATTASPATDHRWSGAGSEVAEPHSA